MEGQARRDGTGNDMAAQLERLPNLVTMFLRRAAEGGGRPFLWRKHSGRWEPTSWEQAAAGVSRLAAALRRLGLAPGDRVLLVSENRPEWLIADLAIMAAGGVTVPAYTTNTPADHAHVLGDSGASLAIVSTERLAEPLFAAIATAPCCRAVIAMEEAALSAPPGVAVHDWTALLAAETADPQALAERAAAIGRNDLACSSTRRAPAARRGA